MTKRSIAELASSVNTKGAPLTAIPTIYNGVQLRSRMEAQCAYLFDYLGWQWEYEKHSFMLPNGTTYTPDFWIESACLFVECRGYVKPRGERQLEGFARMAEEGHEHPELGVFSFMVIGPKRVSLFNHQREPFVPLPTRHPYAIGNGLICRCGCGWTVQNAEWCPNCQELPHKALMISVDEGKIFCNGMPIDELSGAK